MIAPTAVLKLSQSRRGVAIVVLSALVVVAGSSSSGAATRSEEPAAAIGRTPQPPLVGTWRRLTTCAELATALRKAGLQKFVLEAVAGNGFIPAVTTPGQIADPKNPCVGAVPRRHSHFFTKDGRFGSLDWRGQEVDDGRYRIVNNRTVVIFKEFPKVTFHYRIRGTAITFAPVLPAACSTFRCAWAISMAYPGKAWQRVR